MQARTGGLANLLEAMLAFPFCLPTSEIFYSPFAIQVTIQASSEEHLRSWSGFCHSRLRLFVLKVAEFLKARIWPEAQELDEQDDQSSESNPRFAKHYYIGVSPYTDEKQTGSSQPRRSRYDLRVPIRHFCCQVG